MDMENKSEEKAKCSSLLYIGALYDSYPLTLRDIRRAHDVIIYSDALPASGIYPKLNTEEKILEILVEEGGRHGITSEFVRNEVDGSYEADLKDSCRLKYFFNTSDIDNALLPLDTVTTLWLHGYVPPQDILRYLPNLKMVYAAGSCVDDELPTYWEAREKLGMMEEEKMEEYNCRCWIPDVLQWISAEEGFELVGSSESLMNGFMLCDAPFQFIVDEGGEEDQDSICSDEKENGVNATAS